MYVIFTSFGKDSLNFIYFMTYRKVCQIFKEKNYKEDVLDFL